MLLREIYYMISFLVNYTALLLLQHKQMSEHLDKNRLREQLNGFPGGGTVIYLTQIE